MKRIAKIICGCICVASIILAGCENLDGSCNLAWTLSWLAVATLSGIGLNRMEGRDNG